MAPKYNKAAQIWNTREQRVSLIPPPRRIFADGEIANSHLIQSTKTRSAASSSAAYYFVTR